MILQKYCLISVEINSINATDYQVSCYFNWMMFYYVQSILANSFLVEFVCTFLILQYTYLQKNLDDFKKNKSKRKKQCLSSKLTNHI